MNENEKKTALMFTFCGIVPIVYLGLSAAPHINEGVSEILNAVMLCMQQPKMPTLCRDSLKTVLVFLLIYLMGTVIYTATRRNYRKGIEHGSAKWASAGELNRKYMQKPICMNKILSQNVVMGLEARLHMRNLNTLVIGGSGSGKTRFYCKPNIMQANTSFVVLDPKGEIRGTKLCYGDGNDKIR